MRYIVKKAYLINVQENDTCNIVFNVPVDISMVGKEVELTVLNLCTGPNPDLVLSEANGKVIVAGQVVTCSVLPADTLGKSGNFFWHLRLIGSATDKLTIGKGKFQIIPLTQQI